MRMEESETRGGGDGEKCFVTSNQWRSLKVAAISDGSVVRRPGSVVRDTSIEASLN